MSFIGKLDSKGRVLIPKLVREQLGISSGAKVKITVRYDVKPG